MDDATELAQPDARPLLAIEDLSKGFTLHAADRRVRGCEHISLSVLPGEFVGVTGRSGSGKSTILKCRKAATSCTIPRPLARLTLPRSTSVA